jgi:hypothetical protein
MTSVRPRLAGLVAATLVAAAGLVGLSTGPAAAALCSGAGVNVVVDFQGLGGGVQKGCDRNGAGRSADKVLPAAGFPLKYAVREPGFVCRVKNTPTSDPCGNASPTDAYWGLYWSNGKNGVWNYSSSGVGGTSVPKGGFIAFSWQNGGSADKPRASAVNRQSAPATKAPAKPATKAPQKKRSTQSGSTSQSTEAPGQTTPEEPTKTSGAAGTSQPKKQAEAAKAKASKKAKTKKKAKKKAKAKASAKASASAAASADPSDDASSDVSSAEKVNSTFTPEEDQGGLPVWVPIVVIVALAGSAGAAAWWRRRTGAT